MKHRLAGDDGRHSYRLIQATTTLLPSALASEPLPRFSLDDYGAVIPDAADWSKCAQAGFEGMRVKRRRKIQPTAGISANRKNMPLTSAHHQYSLRLARPGKVADFCQYRLNAVVKVARSTAPTAAPDLLSTTDRSSRILPIGERPPDLAASGKICKVGKVSSQGRSPGLQPRRGRVRRR